MEESIKEEIVMVPLRAVSRFKWDRLCGERLRLNRGKRYTRKHLATLIAALQANPSKESGGRMREDSCSPRFIQRLEEGDVQSISADTVLTIADILDVRIDDLLGINLSIETHR